MRTLQKFLQISKGFSLIEVIVSISVFAISVTSVIGVYLSIQNLNQRSLSNQVLEQNARFAIQDITKIIRNGRIDYGGYPGGTVPQPYTSSLYLIDPSGIPKHIFLDNKGTPGILDDELVLRGPGGTTVPYFSDNVVVTNIRFYIWPNRDPFNGGVIAEQPTVTVHMWLGAVATAKELDSSGNYNFSNDNFLQFTTATREY